MSAYWIAAAVVFVALWLPMVRKVCIDAAAGAGIMALAFIPLFTIGLAIAAIVWPLTLICSVVLGYVYIASELDVRS